MRNKTQRTVIKVAGYTVQLELETRRIRVKQWFEWSRWYRIGKSGNDLEQLSNDFPKLTQHLIEDGIRNLPKTRVGDECVTEMNGFAVRGKYVKDEFGNEQLFYNMEDFSKVIGVSVEEIKAEFGI